MMIRHSAAFAAQHREVQRWDLSNVNNELAYTEESLAANTFTSEESLVKDAQFLLIVFLSRNNHISKICAKARPGVQGILAMLQEKYMIDDDIRESGVSVGAEIVTLPRIAEVFPAIAVRLFHLNLVKEIVLYSSFPEGVMPNTHAICCPFLPSLAPKALMRIESNNFHPAMFWAAVKLDDVIHKRDGRFTSLEDIMTYYKAGFNSQATPEASRVQVFKNIGLNHPVNNVLTEQARGLASRCMAELTEMRQADQSHF